MLRLVCLHNRYSDPASPNAPQLLASSGQNEAIRLAFLRPKSAPDRATPALKRRYCGAAPERQFRSALEDERSQLIERVDRLEADQEKHQDHQDKAEMHGGLAINRFVPRAEMRPGS